MGIQASRRPRFLALMRYSRIGLMPHLQNIAAPPSPAIVVFTCNAKKRFLRQRTHLTLRKHRPGKNKRTHLDPRRTHQTHPTNPLQGLTNPLQRLTNPLQGLTNRSIRSRRMRCVTWACNRNGQWVSSRFGLPRISANRANPAAFLSQRPLTPRQRAWSAGLL